MSYNKRTWATGNVVGAVDLNRMEQGIEDASGSGAESLICTEEDGHLDKTFGELRMAHLNGVPIIVHKTQDNGESGTAVYIEALVSITYTTASVQAYGDIICDSLSYTVIVEEAPYTIEALDALYPHVPD